MKSFFFFKAQRLLIIFFLDRIAQADRDEIFGKLDSRSHRRDNANRDENFESRDIKILNQTVNNMVRDQNIRHREIDDKLDEILSTLKMGRREREIYMSAQELNIELRREVQKLQLQCSPQNGLFEQTQNGEGHESDPLDEDDAAVSGENESMRELRHQVAELQEQLNNLKEQLNKERQNNASLTSLKVQTAPKLQTRKIPESERVQTSRRTTRSQTKQK